MTLENFEKMVTEKYRDDNDFAEFLRENPDFTLELERENEFLSKVSFDEDELSEDTALSYLEEINLTEEMSDDEREELLENLDDENVREKIVLDNLPEAARIGLYFCRQGVEYIELVQEGTMGIIKAINNYTYDAGNFKKYVSLWIGKEMAVAVEDKFEQTKTEFLYYMTKTHMDEVEITEEEKDKKIKAVERTTIDDIPFKLGEKEIKIIELYFGLGKEKRYSILDIEKELSLVKDTGEAAFYNALGKISSIGGRMFVI